MIFHLRTTQKDQSESTPGPRQDHVKNKTSQRRRKLCVWPTWSQTQSPRNGWEFGNHSKEAKKTNSDIAPSVLRWDTTRILASRRVWQATLMRLSRDSAQTASGLVHSRSNVSAAVRKSMPIRRLKNSWMTVSVFDQTGRGVYQTARVLDSMIFGSEAVRQSTPSR